MNKIYESELPSVHGLASRIEILENLFNELKKWKEVSIKKNIQDISRIKELELAFLAANERIEIFEDHIHRYHKLVLGACPLDIEKNIRENMSGKIPHKCPVCEGEAKRQVWDAVLEPFETRIIDSQGRHFVACHVCKGEGILWNI